MLVFISAIPCGTEMSDYFLVSFKVKQDAPAVEQIYTSVEDATEAVSSFFKMSISERFDFCSKLYQKTIPDLKAAAANNVVKV